MMLPDSLTASLREIAAELLGAKTDAQTSEAVRAFLTTCQSYGVKVDDAGEIVSAG